MVACFINSYAFHALVENFHSNCVSGATLAYREIMYRPEAGRPSVYNARRYEDKDYKKKVDHYYDEFKSYHWQAINTTDDVEATPEPKTKLFQLKSEADGDALTTTTERYGYGLLKKKPVELNANDSAFFQSCEWFWLILIAFNWSNACGLEFIQTFLF